MKPKSLYPDSTRPPPLPILGPRVAYSPLNVVIKYTSKFAATRRHLAYSGPCKNDNIRLAACLFTQ